MGGEKCGFHAFRRFRITHLRKQRVMEVLLRIWWDTPPKASPTNTPLKHSRGMLLTGRPRQSKLALVSTQHWNTNCQLHELHPECTRLNSLQVLEVIGRP